MLCRTTPTAESCSPTTARATRDTQTTRASAKSRASRCGSALGSARALRVSLSRWHSSRTMSRSHLWNAPRNQSTQRKRYRFNRMEYYILSLNHSPVAGKAVWWGPSDCGYTEDLKRAGRYTAEQISKNRAYYNNGVTTRAIFCFDVDRIVSHCIDYRRAMELVPNRSSPPSCHQ